MSVVTYLRERSIKLSQNRSFSIFLVNSRMKAQLTGYFWTYSCVYLPDSACKRIFVIITQLGQYNSSNLLQFFSRIIFSKSHLFYFVWWAKAYGFCLRARAVNSDYILNLLETVKLVFCLQIHALAECTMNLKFSVLQSARRPRAVYKIFSFIVHSARACIFKQNTHNSL